MSVIDRIDVEIGANSSNFVAEFTKAGQAAEQFDAKLKGLGSSSFGDKIAGEATQAVSGFKTLESAVDSLVAKLQKIDIGKNLQGVSNITGKLSTEMRNIGVAASLLSVPVDLFAKSSLDTYASLESQIKRNTALIGGGQKEYEELLALSKELGGTTPFSTKGIAEGIESLAAAGYNLDDIKATMGTVTEMSIATGEPLANMSDILVNVLSQFQAGPEQADKFANVLAVGANESTASVTDMGEALKYAGNMATATNKGVEEVSAALAVMANNGVKGTMAGTGIVDILGDLANPPLAAQTALKQLGLTKEDIDPTTHSLEELLTTLNQAGLAKPENVDSLFAIFGKQGAPKISSLISDEGLAQYKEIVRQMTYESDGAIKQFADSQRDSLAFAMDQIGESYIKVQEKVGEGLKPLVVKINDFLQENGDVLEEFAKNAVEGLTPLVEKFLSIAKDAMEWFNSLPSDMRSKIASLTGMGTAIAAIGGPLLLLGSIPVGALSSLTGALAQLFTLTRGAAAATTLASGVTTLVTSLQGLSGVTAVANIGQYITPIGPAAAGAASQVGLLSTALAGLSTGGVLVGLLGVSAAVLAWETDFMQVRSKTLDAADNIFAGLQNSVTTGLSLIQGAGNAFSKALTESIQIGPGYKSNLVPELKRVLAEATDTAGLEGRAAANAWIEAWNADIASGRIKAPKIPDSETASRSGAGIPTDTSGATRTIVDNGTPTVVIPNAGGYDQSAFNDAWEKAGFGKSSTTTNQAQVTAEGTAKGVKAAAPSIAEQLAKDRGWYYRGELDVGMAERMLQESPQLADKYKQVASETNTKATDTNTGATEELSGSVKELTSSVDSATAATVSTPATVTPVADQSKIFSGAPGGDKPTDEFTLDPKSYLDRKLANVFATTEYKDLPAFEAYLKQFGKDLEYQANKWFKEEKDAGFGGNWDWTDWWGVARGETSKSNEELKKTGDITEENTIEAKKFNTELSKTPKAIKEITDTAKKAKGTSESELSGTAGKFTVADASVIQCKALECTGDSTFTGDVSGDVALPSAIGCVFGGSASHVQLPTFDNAPWISAIEASRSEETSRIQGTWNQNSDTYYQGVARKTASWGLKDAYLGDISGGNVYYNCKFGNVLQGSGQIESMRARGNDSSLISSFRGSPGGTGQPVVNTAASQQVDKAASSLNQLGGAATSFVQSASGGFIAGTQFNGVIDQIKTNLQQTASGASAAAPAIASLPPQLSALTSASNSAAASISSAVSRINSYIASASAAAAGMVAGAASGETQITVSGNTFNRVQNAGSFIADLVRNVRAGG